jgi:biopolymer transport protein TolQ
MKWMLVFGILVSQGGKPPGVLQLVFHAGPMVKLVLLILVFFSIFSWAIIGWKYLQIRKAGRESSRFLEAFWSGGSLEDAYEASRNFRASPLVIVFRSGYQELNRIRERTRKGENPKETPETYRLEMMGVDNVARAMRQASTSEVNRITKYLSFLATTGSATPFIGLFGTVWGIMNSFQRLAIQKTAGLDVVAPGISEALVATAAGLAAAIPAVIAYNFFLNRVRVISSELDNFSGEFLNIVERHFLKKKDA